MKIPKETDVVSVLKRARAIKSRLAEMDTAPTPRIAVCLRSSASPSTAPGLPSPMGSGSSSASPSTAPGLGLEELKAALEEKMGLKDIIVCTQNPLNGKLNPLRLDLPPHHVKMHLFLVPPTSKVAGDLVMASTAP